MAVNLISMNYEEEEVNNELSPPRRVGKEIEVLPTRRGRNNQGGRSLDLVTGGPSVTRKLKTRLIAEGFGVQVLPDGLRPTGRT